MKICSHQRDEVSLQVPSNDSRSPDSGRRRRSSQGTESPSEGPIQRRFSTSAQRQRPQPRCSRMRAHRTEQSLFAASGTRRFSMSAPATGFAIAYTTIVRRPWPSNRIEVSVSFNWNRARRESVSFSPLNVLRSFMSFCLSQVAGGGSDEPQPRRSGNSRTHGHRTHDSSESTGRFRNCESPSPNRQADEDAGDGSQGSQRPESLMRLGPGVGGVSVSFYTLRNLDVVLKRKRAKTEVTFQRVLIISFDQ